MSVAIGWWLLAAGFISGAVMGLLAQDENWLEGYGSRRRRLVRLGHIALVALGALNIIWPLTATAAESTQYGLITTCFVIGGVTMGPICFLSAVSWSNRVAFVVPSTALIAGAVLAGWESIP